MPGPWAFLSGWWLVDNGDNVPALEFAGLVKRFGDNVAVDHIDLVVPAGSFFGLVGPNGAGKTTSLSMAVGLLRGMPREVVAERADELLRVLELDGAPWYRPATSPRPRPRR
jgi:ABC-type branched-subunit amino acid transport system ATPase component